MRRPFFQALLDERQRAWIFQPSDRSWGGSALAARDMDDVWIEFESRITGQTSQLHGLWLEADKPLASLATGKMLKTRLRDQLQDYVLVKAN